MSRLASEFWVKAYLKPYRFGVFLRLLLRMVMIKRVQF
jgi:hypothetical protein